MNLIFKISIIFIVGAMLGCGTSSKTTSSQGELKYLQDLVASRSFKIESNWAMPLMTRSMNSISNAGLLPVGSAGNQINLFGNSNYLKVEGDTVSAFLPYFGERQMGAGYASNTNAIQFKGVPENYKVVDNTGSNSKEISFNINNKTEGFRVHITLNPDLSSNINVNSTARFTIRYKGEVMPIGNEQY
ncbi:DUF4251 domain-containing protein [Sediminicola sp. 1XM1-17]|uniref:DUF4251 domain-containing protein n=1 Tax=Sediminicola sp. 1XM1-17 TaxID=3127702 RepID=UPI0030770AD0